MKDDASKAATEVATEAEQVFRNGYLAEYRVECRVEQLTRDATSLMIYADSHEVQITHIAKGPLREGVPQ